MGKSLDIILKIKSEVEKTLPKNLDKVAEEMKKVKKEREKLEKHDKLIQNYKKVEQTLKEQKKALENNKNALNALEQLKKSGIRLTTQEETKYKQLTREQKKLENQIKDSTRAYKKYGMQVEKLKIPYDQLQKELRQTIKLENELKAKQKIKTWGEGVKQKYQGFKDGVKDKVKTSVVAGTALTIAGLGASAKSFIEYDKGIRKVKALTGATEEDFKKLSQEAIRLGNTTKFTALEATQGMEKFALAGFKPQQIIDSLAGVMDLAAASGEDFTMIADIVSDHMRAYNIDAKDVNKMTDIMANTMARSNVSIETLGETLKYVSPAASALKMDFATVAAATGLMGDQALKSGQAGINLKAALGQLADPKVQKSLKKYGVKVKDVQRNFVGLIDLVQQLEKKTSKMTGLKKLEFFKKNFGERGAMAIMNLVTAEKEVNGQIYKGAEALRMFSKENENALGTAQKMKNVMMEGAGGSWDLFVSAIDGLKITVGEKLFGNGGLDLLKIATTYINELSNVIQGITNDTQANKFWQEMKVNFDKIVEVAKLAADGFIQIGKAINFIGIDNILVFITLFTMTSKVSNFVGAIQGAVAVISQAGGVLAAAQTGIAALGGPISLVIAVFGVLIYMIYKNWDTIKNWITIIKDLFATLFEKIIQFIAIFIDIILQITTAFWEKIKKGFLKLVEGVKKIWDSLVNTVLNITDYFVNLIKKYWWVLLGPLGIVTKLIITYWENIKAAFILVVEGIKNVWNWLMDTVLAIIDYAINLIKEYWWVLLGPLGVVTKLIITYWEQIKTAFVTIADNIVVTWDNLVDTVGNLVSTIKNNIIDSLSGAYDKVKGFFSEIKNSILDAIKSTLDFSKTLGNIPVVGTVLKKVGIINEISNNAQDLQVDGSHRDGLDYVPFDGYIAKLHKGERVLTSQENNSYSNNVSKPTININFAPVINSNTNNNNEIIALLQNEIEKLYQKIEELMESEDNARRVSL